MAGKWQHFAGVTHTEWLLTGRNEQAVHSTRVPGRGKRVELEVSKPGEENGAMRNKINYLGNRLRSYIHQVAKFK